jgi:hypothetical protein
MTSAEAFKRFQLKINKNDTNTDVDINRGEFVLLYNEQKDIWLREKVHTYQSSDAVHDLQEIQVKYKELELLYREKDYDVFNLPDNFSDYISSYSLCTDGTCPDIIIRHLPFKPKNENMLLESSNYEPSLEFEETVVDLSNNQLFVYKKDFSVTKTLLNYYRNVGAIDIEGYIKLDGSLSTNIDPDLTDLYVDEILNRCAKEVIRRYENPEGFQLAQDRLNSEK